jgi:competence protein ComEC
MVFLVPAWIFYAAGKNNLPLLFLLLAAAGAGAAALAINDRAYEANSLRRSEERDYVDVSGTLLATPGREPGRDVLVLRVDSVKDRGREHKAEGNLRLVVPIRPGSGERLKLHSGDRVSAAVRLSSGAAFSNFGGFSYDLYLKGRRIHRRAFAKSSLLVRKSADGPRFRPGTLMSRIRCAFQDHLERLFPAIGPGDISAQGAVLEALLLGEDGRLDPGTVLALQQSGLYHLFAISGGHIAIIAFLLFSLLRLIRVPRAAADLALIVFLLLYTLFVEGSPSVIRASSMTVAYLLGRLLWKEVRVLNTIAASAFALLLANPFSLFDAGFQLTYVATFSIILFAPAVIKRLPRLPLKMGELTALSLSALAGVLPIIAWHFNRVTFASLILNYAAIPLVGLTMGLGYSLLPLSAALPFLGPPVAAGLKFLVTVFSGISHLADGVPLLSYRIPTPRGWTVVGYFLLLLLLLPRPRFRAQRPLAAAGVVVFFVILVTYPFRPRSEDLSVTLIDVGQGDSLLVEFPGRERMLIDGGGFPDNSFDVGERVVSPVLWRRGLKRIDVLVLTHPHPDHLDGLAAVARNFRIGEFWEAYPPSSPGPGPYAELLKALGPGTPRRRIFRGFSRRIGGVLVTAVHPAPGDGPGPPGGENDFSLVLRLAFGRTSFLLTGDIEAEAERRIVEREDDIGAFVLKSPHHGSSSSSTEPFLDRVLPAIVLIPVGRGNRYGFPSPAVLESYRRRGAAVYRTDLDGAVRVSTDGRSVVVRTSQGISTWH